MYCESFVEVAIAKKELVERKAKYRLLEFSSRACRLQNTPQY
jgi:hypothetical protein